MMKTIFKYLLPAVLTVLSAAACEDHRSDYLEDFQTMVYFRNGGEQDLTLFRTGEAGFYKIPVCKSGRNLSGTATAVVIPFDEAQMAMYNIRNESSYTLIPATVYTFTDEKRNDLQDQSKVELEFGPSDAYQLAYISIDTNALSALQESNPEKDYVFGFQVFAKENVSESINLIILKPGVEIPQLALVSTGVETHIYTSASPESESYHNTLSLNIDENKWDFTCTIAPGDAAWLADYNYNNGKNYELLPAEAYTLSTTDLHFVPGELDAGFDVEIRRGSMDMLKEYALPIVVTACDKEEFAINKDKSYFLVHVRLDPDEITLSQDMVEVSANHEGDGTGAPALVDGDILTYWHSPWSGSVTNADPIYGIYVDISLKSPLRAIVLHYWTRYQNGNGIPTHVVVGVSNDKSTWTVIDGGDVATDEMASATTGQEITLPVMKHSETFKYIRLGIAESVAGDLRINYTSSPKWTSLAEIKLFGTNN